MTCSVERVAMPNYCRGSVAAFGVAHTSANFTTPGPTFNLLLKKSDNSFEMALPRASNICRAAAPSLGVSPTLPSI